ncbi:MAG: GntR family transcriptional regulator [Lachnospiraceae bacterium]|nr:GntR family transcriptional regulator [Lachnospiraceae bacterium]
MAIKYKWLTEILREWIHKNISLGNVRLPSEMELCTKYKVSRQTVRLSLSILEQEGLIEKRHGSGSYITGLSSDASANTIGILISNKDEYFYPGLLDDITGSLKTYGYSCKIWETHNEIAREREILLELIGKPLRAILVEGCKSALPNPNPTLYKKLQEMGTTVLFLNNYYPELSDILYIKDDNLSGSEQLIRHLANAGHTSIAGIFKIDDLQGTERYRGFLETLTQLGLPISDGHVGWFSTRELNQLQAAQDTLFLKSFIKNSLSDCTAVVCHNDEIAYWLIRELQLSGYTLPGDMAVASFDNTYLCTSGPLSITSLSHKLHETGQTAASMIIDKLKGLPVLSREIPWFLVERESSDT